MITINYIIIVLFFLIANNYMMMRLSLYLLMEQNYASQGFSAMKLVEGLLDFRKWKSKRDKLVHFKRSFQVL